MSFFAPPSLRGLGPTRGEPGQVDTTTSESRSACLPLQRYKSCVEESEGRNVVAALGSVDSLHLRPSLLGKKAPYPLFLKLKEVRAGMVCLCCNAG